MSDSLLARGAVFLLLQGLDLSKERSVNVAVVRDMMQLRYSIVHVTSRFQYGVAGGVLKNPDALGWSSSPRYPPFGEQAEMALPPGLLGIVRIGGDVDTLRL